MTSCTHMPTQPGLRLLNGRMKSPCPGQRLIVVTLVYVELSSAYSQVNAMMLLPDILMLETTLVSILETGTTVFYPLPNVTAWPIIGQGGSRPSTHEAK